MSLPMTFKKTVAVAMLGLVGMIAGPSSAKASDGCAPACRYIWVTNTLRGRLLHEARNALRLVRSAVQGRQDVP